MTKDLLLVGSVPMDTVQDVFQTFGAKLGKFLPAMPDGEVGPRRHWISRVHYQVLALHPDLEVVQQPAKDPDGREHIFPRNAGDSWMFRVRDGVDQILFGERGWRLGYAHEALNSYFVFRTLREKGIVPQDLRFQVSMPMVNSVLPPRLFPNVADREKVIPGFTQALRDEVETIVSKIPNDDLALQFDCSTELQDAYGNIPGFPADTAIQRNVGQIEAICPHIPSEVALGFHMCFGTLGGWPRFEPPDIGGAVGMANAFVAHSGRRVDWVHIPLVNTLKDSFYAPLANLEPQGARVFLGLIHNMESLEQRIAIARKYVDDFGLAAYCGFGRVPPPELPKILGAHLKAVNAN